MTEPTPMLRQYLDLKKQYPGTLLFFRLGDFYEMFNEDAVVGSKALDITLTARQKQSDNPIPMCGVPHHAAASYIAKLVRKGFRVAICEQTEEATAGKKLVNRDVVRVITPGTAIDEQLLDQKQPVYLAALSGSGGKYGLAYLELSTGEFKVLEFEGPSAWSSLIADIETVSPDELLYPKSFRPMVENQFGGESNNLQNNLYSESNTLSSASIVSTQLSDNTYDTDICKRLLTDRFGTIDLSGFGIEDRHEAIKAAGACLSYIRDTQKADVTHITGIELIENSDHLVLDALTIRNLELLKSADGNTKRSLLGVIDETVTAMGSRTLRSWLLRPSIKPVEIEARKGAVSEFRDEYLRGQIRHHLKNISDLERLTGRVNLGTSNPRDLLSIASSLSEIPAIKSLVSATSSSFLRMLDGHLHELSEISTMIEDAIIDEPPVNTSDGGFVRDGFDPELDGVRTISRDAKKTIAGFEAKAREETGVGSLRVKFNNVFGYFIEISKANLSKVPDHYERRQTLTNSERFTTPELKEWESEVLGADEKIKALESEIFRTLNGRIANETRKLKQTAYAAAVIDTLSALAETSVRRNYCEPTIHEGDELTIKAGRHPVVEAFLNEQFIPNDLALNNSTDRLLIVTGANMGGKSTVLRQSALIQILAQIGSYVPASFARIPICDRIWTRVGASDDLASGRSTFMVEMTETAAILHNATPKSLVLLDEIGRGTSTFDGLSIAWAVAEYLHDSKEHSAKTLFATHYHELTELAEKLPGAKNYQISAKETDGTIVFLHKLQPGKASKSYGIAVAKLAGLPIETIERAKEVLKTLEEYELAVFSDKRATTEKGLAAAAADAGRTGSVTQISLFSIANESLIDELIDIDLTNLSEKEALALLKRLKERIV